MTHWRDEIAAHLSTVRRCVAEHKAAQVDASGRVLCPDCAGTYPRCFWCDGSGVIDDIGSVDAEDVTPFGRDQEQLEHPGDSR